MMLMWNRSMILNHTIKHKTITTLFFNQKVLPSFLLEWLHNNISSIVTSSNNRHAGGQTRSYPMYTVFFTRQ